VKKSLVPLISALQSMKSECEVEVMKASAEISVCAHPMLSNVCDTGYHSQVVSTATSIWLSEVGTRLFHFFFDTLVSLSEEPASNELQKEPSTIMSVGEKRNQRMEYMSVDPKVSLPESNTSMSQRLHLRSPKGAETYMLQKGLSKNASPQGNK
jgi:hypothetical protein